jgi:hypothetical protein
MTGARESVEVSRRIEAPAARIFEILANPQRHKDFDGSDMLRGCASTHPITEVGDIFTIQMHRLGRDYLMINHVVEFEFDRRISWEPSPGDLPTAGGDPSKVGVPAGYRWGYGLTPDGDDATVVTEFLGLSSLSEEGRQHILSEDGAWINGSNSLRQSMVESLEKLEKLATE